MINQIASLKNIFKLHILVKYQVLQLIDVSAWFKFKTQKEVTKSLDQSHWIFAC